MPACRFVITGKVQGVFFRASVREQGKRLGLHGHARNLPDGSVEVIAVGEPDAIQALAAWLHHGPPMARVATVLGSEIDADSEARALALDEFGVA